MLDDDLYIANEPSRRYPREFKLFVSLFIPGFKCIVIYRYPPGPRLHSSRFLRNSASTPISKHTTSRNRVRNQFLSSAHYTSRAKRCRTWDRKTSHPPTSAYVKRRSLPLSAFAARDPRLANPLRGSFGEAAYERQPGERNECLAWTRNGGDSGLGVVGRLFTGIAKGGEGILDLYLLCLISWFVGFLSKRTLFLNIFSCCTV
jgi:hypothetical protein